MAGRSRLPRPVTPVSPVLTSPATSPTVDNSKITHSKSRAIGIRIESFGATSTSSVSVTSRQKSPSGSGIHRPVSAGAGPGPSIRGANPHPQSRASNWASDPNNPYRQPLARSPNRFQQKPTANFGPGHSPSTVPSTGASIRRRSISPSQGTRTQGFKNPSTSRISNPVGANARTLSSATPKPYHSPSLSSAKNKLSPRTAAATAPKPKRTHPSVPHHPSANSGNREERLAKPAYQLSDRDSSLNSFQNSTTATIKSSKLPDEEAKHEVIILSDSDEEEATDVIVLEETTEVKPKPTVAERLVQSLTEKSDDSRRATRTARESRRHHFQRSSQDMHRNYVSYQYQAHMSTQPHQWFGNSSGVQTVLSRPSLLLPGNGGYMPYFSANGPSVAAPYFPPLDAGMSMSARLFSTDSQSSTNSQFENMQVDVDESMENISVQDVARKRLRSVRKWEFTTLGRLYQDSRHHGTRTMDGGTKFTVLSYNLLAPALLSEHSNNLYKDVDPECLDWKNRHELFLTELSEFGYPEILCFQEVEAALYKHFYEVPLAKHGYKGVFKKRTRDKVDGCAIFWKQSMFTLIGKLPIEYYQPHVPLLDRDNIALLIKLQSKIGKMPKIVVGTTHLLFNPKRNDVKLAQVQVVVSELDRFAFSGFNNRGETTYHPIILTGDFNCDPRSSIVRLVTHGELQYANEVGERPKLLVRKGLDDFLPYYLGISDQCQHYRVVLDRYLQWQQHRRNSFELDLKQQHALVNLFSSKQFQTDESGSHNGESQEIATELDPAIHSAIINDINNLGAECTFGAGEISHKLRLCDIYQPKLDRSMENLADFIATTRQGHWVCVDYIFYSKLWNEKNGRRVEGNLKLLKRLGLPTKTQCIDLGRLPSCAVSSDHFPLLAEFILK